MSKICGIYCIKNVFRNKMYIGKSIDINGRIRHHYCKLHSNKHHSHKLQNSWNKYPDEYFISGVVEECSIELLDSRERYYIDLYNTYHEGFNEQIPNGENSGHIFTDEDRLKHSIAMKKAWSLMSEESKQKILDGVIRRHSSGIYNYNKKIILYNSTTFEKELEFDSAKSCAEFLGSNCASIDRVIKKIKSHDKLSYKGFILIRENKNYTITEYLKSRERYSFDVKCRQALRSGMAIANEQIRINDHKLYLIENKESRLASWKLNSDKALESRLRLKESQLN